MVGDGVLRDATAGMRELADALRRIELPTHVEHTVTLEPSVWLIFGFLAGALFVWWMVRWNQAR